MTDRAMPQQLRQSWGELGLALLWGMHLPTSSACIACCRPLSSRPLQFVLPTSCPMCGLIALHTGPTRLRTW